MAAAPPALQIWVANPVGMTPDQPVLLPAECLVVTRTPCLPWAPAAAAAGGLARVSLPTWQLVYALGSKLQVSRVPADLAAARDIAPYQVGFAPPLWLRYLQVLVDSRLFEKPLFHDVNVLRSAVADLTLTTPAEALIEAAHWRAGEPLAAPAAGAAPPPVQLNFLSRISVVELEVSGSAPWADMSRLVGLLGACRTRAARNALGSPARRSATILRDFIVKYFHADRADDESIASHLKRLLASSRLPALFLPATLDEVELREALCDGALYHESADARRRVEETRLYVAQPRLGQIDRHVLSKTADPGTAISLLRRAVGLLPAGSRRPSATDPLADWVEALEGEFYRRRYALDTYAAKDRATPNSVIEDALAELVDGGPGVPAQDPVAGRPAVPLPSEDALRAFIDGRAAQELVVVLDGADVNTLDGRLAVFGRAFAGDCRLAARMLLYGERALAPKHSLLGRLFELRPYLDEYFTKLAVVDLTTGAVPGVLRKVRITGPSGKETAFLDNFLAHQLEHMDMLGDFETPGMLYVHSFRDSSKYQAYPEWDHYCIVAIVTDLREFMGRFFAGIGAPNALPADAGGLSWHGWCDYYLKYLTFARRLATRERQLDWLELGHEQFLGALRLIGQLLHSHFTSSVTGRVLSALLPLDCDPVRILQEKMDSFDRGVEIAAHYDFGIAASSTAPHAPHVLPLLSSRHNKLPKPKPKLKVSPGPRVGDRRPHPSRGGAEEEEGEDESSTLIERGGLTAQPSGQAQGPGSQANWSRWLSKDKDLLSAGKVWTIGGNDGLAKYYGVKVGDKCWPFILSRQLDKNKMSRCGKHTEAGHRTLTDARHVLKDFDYADAEGRFSRPATAEEKLTIEPYKSGGRSATPNGKRPKGQPSRE